MTEAEIKELILELICDIAPEADNLAETNKRLDKIVKLAKKSQKDTGVKLPIDSKDPLRFNKHRRFHFTKTMTACNPQVNFIS